MTQLKTTRQGGLGTSAANASCFLTTRLRLVHNTIFKFLRPEDNAAVFAVSMVLKLLKCRFSVN